MSDRRIVAGMAAQSLLRQRMLASGARRFGWKVGFSSFAAMQRLSVDVPLVGFLTENSVRRSGAICSLGGWSNPVLELEVAVHMAKDLGRASSPELVSAAIGGLSSAIELVDVDQSETNVATILGTNIFHRVAVVGRVDWSRVGGSVAGLVGRVKLNGETVATASDVEAIPGALLGTVAHVARVLIECGETLQRGDIIICGSVVPPIPVRPGDMARGAIDPLGAVDLVLES